MQFKIWCTPFILRIKRKTKRNLSLFLSRHVRIRVDPRSHSFEIKAIRGLRIFFPLKQSTITSACINLKEERDTFIMWRTSFEKTNEHDCSFIVLICTKFDNFLRRSVMISWRIVYEPEGDGFEPCTGFTFHILRRISPMHFGANVTDFVNFKTVAVIRSLNPSITLNIARCPIPP